MSFIKHNPTDLSYPPVDGSLFLPDMVEFNAKRNPTHPFYIFQDEHANDLCRISHLEFYRACQRVAHAIHPGGKGSENDIIAIITNCDTILFQVLVMGVIYAGLVPFPMSPRNSPAAVLNMLRTTGCRRLMTTRHSLGPLLDGIVVGVPELQIEDMPTLAYAYPELGKESESTPFVPYPKAETRPLEDTVLFYLHSSGSTGFPKPIPITNLTAIQWCLTPSIQDHVNLHKHMTVGAAALPSFHMVGMLLQLYCPVVSLKSVAVFPPTSYHDATKTPIIPNPQNTMDVLRATGSNTLFVVPTFLQEWATSVQAIDVLRSLDHVAFGGGPLAKKTGDALVAAGVNLVTAYGGTEVGPLCSVFHDPTKRHLWEWVRFGSNQNIRWVSQGDGTYECQMLVSPMYQPSVENLPDVKGYATSDVFVKHPTTEGLYKIVGRIDDVLIHSSGEKTVPAPMETIIGSNPILSGVCMFGRGRNQTGVLVEPRPECAIDVSDDKQVAEFRNKIWPTVEDANKDAPAFSRIFKEMILMTSRDKPMLRAAKGTVIKKATMLLYDSEIDAIYASVEASSKAGIDVLVPHTWSRAEVENWLMVHATAVHAEKPIEVDVNVFEQGFDSLSATFLRNRIVRSLTSSSSEALRAAASRVSQNMVFSHPTLRLLAGHLIRLLGGEEDGASPSPDPRVEIENMIAKYSLGLAAKIDHGVPGRFHDHHVVLLTGSTGGLGSYLLASLLNHEDVALVYAFNRPSKTDTIQQRQRAAFEDRGLDTALLDSAKLIYVEGDTSRPDLSLDDWSYADIRDSVTVIIHNAWRLDFNLALSSFEPHVRGTRHLIDLAKASKWTTKPKFLFTSSIASAQGWDKRRGVFPEEVQYDVGIAVGAGYGASKYISERILAVSGLTVTSFRIGQIAGGPPRGAWSTSDWVPMIIQSSMSLGALPEARGVVSWLFPHAVSNVILDVAFADQEPPVAVNLVHPRPISWTSVMHGIREALYERRLMPSRIPMIPFSEWVARLEAQAMHADEERVQRMPAIKLLAFVRTLARGDDTVRRGDPSCWPEEEDVDDDMAGLPKFATDVALRVSGTMRDLEPLLAGDARRWVDYWASVGMFVS